MRLRVYKPADVSRSTAWARANPEKSRAIKRRWKERNRGKILLDKKNGYRKKSYGMSLDEYNDRLKLQGNKCEICESEMNRPNLDHDHETGQPRDFLCNRCNSQLHGIEDEAFRVKALRYLDGWKAIRLCQQSCA